MSLLPIRWLGVRHNRWLSTTTSAVVLNPMPSGPRRSKKTCSTCGIRSSEAALSPTTPCRSLRMLASCGRRGHILHLLLLFLYRKQNGLLGKSMSDISDIPEGEDFGCHSGRDHPHQAQVLFALRNYCQGAYSCASEVVGIAARQCFNSLE